MLASARQNKKAMIRQQVCELSVKPLSCRRRHIASVGNFQRILILIIIEAGSNNNRREVLTHENHHDMQ